MTQYRRVGRTGRVMFASAAIVALSLVTYGSAAIASAPTPPSAGAEPATDLAGAVKGGAATGTDIGTVSSGEDTENPTPAGVPGKTGGPGKVVEQDCLVDRPTSTPPDAPKPTKDLGRPVVTAKTDPSAGAGPAPGVGIDIKSGKRLSVGRPGVVATPELREGPDGVKGFVPSAGGGCIAPEPVAKPPVKRPPTGTTSTVDDVPTVTVCADPATVLPQGSGGGSSAEPNPGSIEPDDAQPEDQPLEVPEDLTCVQSDGDTPVSSSDDEPPTDLPSVASDSVGAQEDGASGSAR